LEGDDLHLDIEIPANATVTVFIPATSPAGITEGGNETSEIPGIEFIKMENDRAVFKVGSGVYHFVSKDIGAIIQPVMHTSTPVISSTDTLFLKPDEAMVSLHSATEGAKIYYTTDGSVPSEKSNLYSAPFSLESETMIQAIAYKESLLPSYIQSGKVRFVDPAINGINYKVYEGEWKDKPDLSKLREVSNGRQFDFDVKRIEKREDYVAIEFYGFIQIKKAGVYSFSSWANDGSWVFINNKLMADTPAGTLSGDIRLAEGKYPIRVIYFESTGTESLNVLMSGPGIEKQAIAESLLFFAN